MTPTDSGRPGTIHQPSTSLEPWIVWCGLNPEQDAVVEALGDTCISVYGSLSADDKADRIEQWLRGEAPVLVTKPSIAAWGLNFQRCARQVFVGIGDSYETYYQAIRRSWRFGQARPVRVHVVLTEPEEPIYLNVLRKEREATEMAAMLVAGVAAYERAELNLAARDDYAPTQDMALPTWMVAR
jgi:hypothetical protein